jgi:hypothetical protein
MIIALAISALFLGLLWTDNNNNVYASNNNNNTKPASTITSLPNKPSNITITSNSSSVYSIPSTYVQLDRFIVNYTIAGKISSLSDSSDLIMSTIINDFDKNPNIGYVVNSSRTFSTAPHSTTQLGLPNPFVSEDLINHKVTNEIWDAIAAAAAASTSSIEKHVEIKCTFDMILADYKCS